ncbi:MAG: asparaginase [Anaerolineae bacterium]|nr:MAG: asparaginase [Anaerolineae bacterium]
MTLTPYTPLYELTRGRVVESVHFGALAVVDATGKLLAWAGDPHGQAYLRSTAKPFQALPFIEAGGHTHFNFTQKEVALICASHTGTDAHAEVAAGIQARIGLGEEALQCGVHPPYDAATAERLKAAGQEPTPNRHNCSGKHTGMLAHAVLKGADAATYLEHDNPVQQAILTAFAEMCGLEPREVEIGIDGCSAPNFSVPFHNAAWALARLADPAGLSEPRTAACRTITAAMLAYPEMVSGPDTFDTDLMQATGGRILTKGGAEGYQGVCVMPGALGKASKALGIVLKIADGDRRGWARPAVTLALLAELGALSESEMAALVKYGPRREVTNWRGLLAGEARPCFTLERA